VFWLTTGANKFAPIHGLLLALIEKGGEESKKWNTEESPVDEIETVCLWDLVAELISKCFTDALATKGRINVNFLVT
jgi:hypothetical protein